MNPDKLAKMAASVRTGGKGSVRRKRKAVHRPAGTDEKRLQNQFKRLGLTPISGIEEANLFTNDLSSVLHFENPKLQANNPSNMYVLSGRSEQKQLQELLPGILQQLGPDHIQSLQKMAASMPNPDAAAAGADDSDDDSDVPDLVESFDTTQQKA